MWRLFHTTWLSNFRTITSLTAALLTHAVLSRVSLQAAQECSASQALQHARGLAHEQQQCH